MSEGKAEILRSDLEVEGYRLKNFINLTEEELEMVRKWRNHPDIKRWMYHQHEISEEEHRSFVESLRKSFQNAYWLVKGDERYVGVLYFNRINLEQRHTYFGIYANPYDRIPGAGRILGNLVIKLAFDMLDLHTLKLEVLEDNEKAIRLYANLGFKEEGRLKEFVIRNGRWIDVIVMGVINPNHK